MAEVAVEDVEPEVPWLPSPALLSRPLQSSPGTCAIGACALGRGMAAATAREQRMAAPPAAAVAPAAVSEPEVEEAPIIPAPPPQKGTERVGFVLAVVMIPLLIVGVVVAMLYVRTQAADKQFADVLAGAQNIVTQAEQTTDDAAAAQRLSGAKEFLDQAKALRPMMRQYKDLQTRYDDLVMRVEKVSAAVRHRAAVAVQARDRDTIWRDRSSAANRCSCSTRDRSEVYRFIRSALGDNCQACFGQAGGAEGRPRGGQDARRPGRHGVD